MLVVVINKILSWDFDEGKGRFWGWLFCVVRNVVVDVIDLWVKKVVVLGDM